MAASPKRQMTFLAALAFVCLSESGPSLQVALQARSRYANVHWFKLLLPGPSQWPGAEAVTSCFIILWPISV